MKKFLSIALVLAMMAVMSVTAFAQDGIEPTAPEGGIASVQSDDGTTWTVAGDDDALSVYNDTNGTDIYVWAKVTDSTSTIYKLDLSWGTMKFEYNSGSGQWNPSTHAYDSVGIASWTPTYLNGTNNQITVINHSNHAVDAEFAYTADGTAFNGQNNSDNAVVGNFFDNNTKALAAASVLTGTYTGGNRNTDPNALIANKITLDTADKYNTVIGGTAATNVAADGRTGNVYFAFSGTPDEGAGLGLATFTKVGVITVTIAPNDTVQGTYGTYVG